MSAVVPIDQTNPCDSGSVRISGTLNDNGTGTVSVTYNDCRTGNDTLSGAATMRIDAFDLTHAVITDFTITFPIVTLRGPGVNANLTGTLRSQISIPTNTETLTENFVTQDNNTKVMAKTEDVVFVNVYNNVLVPASFTQSMTGRVFDGVSGFVDITTTVPLSFGTTTQSFPDSGQIVMTGAANSKVRTTAVSATLARLAVDANADGVFENVATLKWTDLAGPLGADLRDNDGDGMHNSWETAYGLDPNNAADAALDKDGDGASNKKEYLAGTDPTSAASIPPVAQLVPLAGASDLAFDSVSGKIYASVRGNPGGVVAIDPVTTDTGSPIPVGIDPVKLARSDNGQYLYVALDGESAVQRIDLASQAVNLKFLLGIDSTIGLPRFVEDMQVLPGNSQAIAASLKFKGSSPRHAGVAVYDNGVQRPTMTVRHTGSNVIEFSASAGTLYGYNNETTEFGFRRMAVDASGVTVLDVFDSFMGDLISGFGVDIRFGGGLIYSTTGRQIDPVARTVLGTFALPTTVGTLVVPDAAIGRVFFLTSSTTSGTWTLRAFDITTRQLLGSEDIAGVAGTPGSLIRYGAKGLAFRTSNDQVFLIESPKLIP